MQHRNHLNRDDFLGSTTLRDGLVFVNQNGGEKSPWAPGLHLIYNIFEFDLGNHQGTECLNFVESICTGPLQVCRP